MQKRGGAKSKTGFTIIEVMLSLAISGMVLVGALIGVSSTVSRQRYRDTVESTAALLRNQYDLVSRVQIDRRNNDDMCDILSGKIGSVDIGTSSGRGRSNCSVYGVAIALGFDDGRRMEVTNLIGQEYNAYRKSLGDDPDSLINAMSEIDLLKNLNLTNVYQEGSVCKLTGLLGEEKYKWDASLQTTEKGRAAKMLIIIARSPRTGAVHTYIWDFSDPSNALEPYDYRDIPNTPCSDQQNGVIKATISTGLKNGNFRMLSDVSNTNDVKLCINSDDLLATYGKRRMMMLSGGGHNSSAVSLIDMDSEGNTCNE